MQCCVKFLNDTDRLPIIEVLYRRLGVSVVVLRYCSALGDLVNRHLDSLTTAEANILHTSTETIDHRLKSLLRQHGDPEQIVMVSLRAVEACLRVAAHIRTLGAAIITTALAKIQDVITFSTNMERLRPSILLRTCLM